MPSKSPVILPLFVSAQAQETPKTKNKMNTILGTFFRFITRSFIRMPSVPPASPLRRTHDSNVPILVLGFAVLIYRLARCSMTPLDAADTTRGRSCAPLSAVEFHRRRARFDFAAVISDFTGPNHINHFSFQSTSLTRSNSPSHLHIAKSSHLTHLRMMPRRCDGYLTRYQRPSSLLNSTSCTLSPFSKYIFVAAKSE